MVKVWSVAIPVGMTRIRQVRMHALERRRFGLSDLLVASDILMYSR